MIESIKAVFDTNILVSGQFWKGPPYRCILAIEAGLAPLVLSDPILTEFKEKLTNKIRHAEVRARSDRRSMGY